MIEKTCQKALSDGVDLLLQNHYGISLNDKSEVTELLRELLSEIYIWKGLEDGFDRLKKRQNQFSFGVD